MPNITSLPGRLPAAAAALAAAISAAGGASASPRALDCSASGTSLALALKGSVDSSPEARMSGLAGELAVSEAGLPEDLARVRLTGDHLVSRWIVGNDLRLHIVWERDGHRSGSAEVTLRTSRRPAAPERYEGTYRVALSDAPEGGEAVERKLEGRVACTLRQAGG